MALSLDSLIKQRDENKPHEASFYNPAQFEHLQRVVRQHLGVVCQVQTPTDKGTGCLIGGNLLITNYHVIPDKETAATSHAIFFRVTSQDVDKTDTSINTKCLSLDPSRYFYQSPANKVGDIILPADSDHLDFTIVAITPHPYLEQVQDLVFSIFNKIEPAMKALTCILQHPDVIDSKTSLQGDLKWSIGLVHRREDCSIHYDTETAPGSSGGAVMSEKGDLIALHYQGLGSCGCDPRHPYCNAGVLISEIAQHLEKKGERAKLEEVIRNYHREISLRHSQFVQSLANHLTSFYQKQMTAVYKVRAKGAWEISLSIEGVFTDLAMFFVEESQTENDSSKAGKGILNHKTPSRTKKSITFRDIFDHEKLKNASFKRGVIFGVAGIGKTTLCQKLALEGTKLWPQFKAVFLIKLRNLNEKKYPRGPEGYTPYEILAKECQFDLATYQSLLNDPKFLEDSLLLLDGYDELPKDAENGTLSEAFQKLQELFPHILITARPTLVNIDYLTEFEISGFDRQNIDVYIEKFFSLLAQKKELTEDEAKRKCHKLKQVVKQRDILTSLLQIPINLSLACSLCREDEAFFDSNQASATSFYLETINWFYKKYQLRPGISGQSEASIRQQKNPRAMCEKVNLLAITCEEIAWWAMQQNTLSIDQGEIEKILGGKGLSLDDLTHLGLLSLDEGQGEFIHHTFQEYFVAAYVAHFYIQKKQAEGLKILQKIKFNSRYFVALPLIAGILSYQRESVGLKAFFKDITSEPYDLTVGYELRLLARCFAECQDLTVLKEEYNAFIRRIITYLQADLSIEVKTEVFIGNPQLFQQEEIVQLFEERPDNEATRVESLPILERLALMKQIFPEKFITMIIKVLQKTKVTIWERISASTSLFNVIRNGQILSQNALDELILLLINSREDSWGSTMAGAIICEVSKSGQILSSKSIVNLVAILRFVEIKREARIQSSDILREVIKSGQVLPPEAVEDLINTLRDADEPVAQGQSAIILSEVIKSRQDLPRGVVDVLIALIDAKVDSEIRNQATAALCSMANKKAVPQDTVESLINSLRISSISTDPKTNSLDLRSSIIILGEVAQSGQVLSLDVVKGLIAVLKNPNVQNEDKNQAAIALGKVAKNSQSLQQVLQELLLLLNEYQAGSDVCGEAANALGEVVKNGQVLPPQVIKTLIALLGNLEAKDGDRDRAGHTLGEVVRRGQELPQEEVEKLSHLLRKPHVNTLIRGWIVNVLHEIANKRQVLPQKAVESLFVLIINPLANFESQSSADHALNEMAKKELGEIAKKGLFMLVGDFLLASRLQQLAASALGALARNGQAQSNEVMKRLINFLNDSKADLKARKLIADDFGEAAKRGQILFPEVVKGLIAILKDVKHPKDISDVATALEKVAKSDQVLLKEVEKELIILIRETGIDSKLQGKAVEILLEVTKSEQMLLRKELIVLLRDRMADPNTRGQAAAMLGEWAKSGQMLPQNALEGLIDLLSTREARLWNRSQAAKALGKAAKNNQILSPETIDEMVELLTSSSVELWSLEPVAAALCVVATQQTLPQNGMQKLIKLLENKQTLFTTRVLAATILGEVVKSRQIVPQQAVEGIIALIEIPEVDHKDRECAALGKMVKNGQEVYGAAQKLFDLLKNTKTDVLVRRKADIALGEMIKNGHALSQELLNAICCDNETSLFTTLLNLIAEACCKFRHPCDPNILKKLFFLTGRAFYFYEGNFYTSGSDAPIITGCPMNSKRVYQELLNSHT